MGHSYKNEKLYLKTCRFTCERGDYYILVIRQQLLIMFLFILLLIRPPTDFFQRTSISFAIVWAYLRKTNMPLHRSSQFRLTYLTKSLNPRQNGGTSGSAICFMNEPLLYKIRTNNLAYKCHGQVASK